MPASAICRSGGIVRRDEQADPHIPGIERWPDLPELEREHREAVLADIRRRVEADGPRVAVAAADRGRLFMPFAALKGYGELVESVERDEE